MRGSINLLRGNRRPSEEEVRQAVEKMLPAFVYVGGYAGSDSSVVLACRKCGNQITRSMVTIRHGKHTTCPVCSARKREEDKRAEMEAKTVDRMARMKAKEKGPVACKCCGSLFVRTRQRLVYCSAACARRVENNHKDKRLRGQKGIDWTITVPALVQRDDNVCHICGGLCDSKDYTINENGHFIAGPTYPSIDHVIPISKGGRHKWDNVRLAHIYCNTVKRDNLI